MVQTVEGMCVVKWVYEESYRLDCLVAEERLPLVVIRL